VEGVRRAWAWLVCIDHHDPDVRRRGETGVTVMVVMGVAAVLAVPVFAVLPDPELAIVSVLAPLPFVVVFIGWCRRGLVDRAALGLGLVLWGAVVGQAILTGDPSANMFYAAICAVIVLFMLPTHHHRYVVLGIVTALAVCWAFSSDDRTLRLGRGELLVNGAIVALATTAVTIIGARRLAESHRAERRAVELSVRDPLTGLHNRRHIDQMLPLLVGDAVESDRPLSVAIADLDHFKSVNDDWSYAVGDQVLRTFSAVAAATGRTDDVVARYGGEEFLIAMPDTDLDGAAALCDRLRRRVEAVDWESIAPGLRITVSFGVASTHEDSVQVAGAVVSAADERLHAAKRQGRNRVAAVA
jgi:diguanylate cyclase (GGDEF)-like protein